MLKIKKPNDESVNELSLEENLVGNISLYVNGQEVMRFMENSGSVVFYRVYCASAFNANIALDPALKIEEIE